MSMILPDNWFETWADGEARRALEKAMATETDRRVASVLYSIERRNVADAGMPLDKIAPIYLTLAMNLRDPEHKAALVAALAPTPEHPR